MHYVDNNLTLTKTSNSISYNTTYQLAVDLETGTSSTALLCATIPVFTLHNMLILCLLILNQNFIQGTDPIFTLHSFDRPSLVKSSSDFARLTFFFSYNLLFCKEVNP